MGKTVVLAILDGWGIGRKDYSNPIHIAQPPHIIRIRRRYRYGALQSAGIAVGLPWEEAGNSEVGHVNIGAGKIVYQHYPKITLAIRSGEFFKNPAFTNIFKHVRKNGGTLHLISSLSKRTVDASLEHVSALLSTAKTNSLRSVSLHFISDGKDSPPQSLLKLLEKVRTITEHLGIGTVTTISGRYYALDQEQHWDRTAKAYETLVGNGPTTSDLDTTVHGYYDRGLDDQFIEPISVGENPQCITDNDAIIFCNFREDGIRQLAAAFAVRNFNMFKTKPLRNLAVVTMTNYDDNFSAAVAFPNDHIDNPLGKVVADAGRLQLRVAESEKYTHVTLFLNGYHKEPFQGEYRVNIPSRNIPRHDAAPEMMAREVTQRMLDALTGDGFDLIVGNYANPDIIAHTGNFDAAIQAIMVIDEEIGKLATACTERNAVLIITSDHGNVERMFDPYTGRAERKHDPNLVPLHLIGRGFESEKNDIAADEIEQEAVGILADVAPTILDLMDIEKPKEMTGESLLNMLR